MKEAVSLFGAESPKKIGLVTTIQHVHELPRVAELLKGMNIGGVIAEGGSRTPYAGQILGCSYGAARKTGCGNILFIGTGVFHPTGIALSAGVGGVGCGGDRPNGKSATVVALDPFMKRVQFINTDKLLCGGMCRHCGSGKDNNRDEHQGQCLSSRGSKACGGNRR